jgi:two-component system, OmpR family, catabolic regulation response regulator CreB
MHILLLEDERSIADTIVYAFAREGWRVTHVALVGDARAASARETFDAHVLDVGVPDGSGLDLCRELHAKRAAPVIMLTARGEEIDRVLGLELGADDYMTKPFSLRELAARVKAVVRRRGPSADSSPKNASPFTHDANGLRIALRGRWLDLTRLEYGCLAALIGAPERILTRAHLLDVVWGDDAQSTDRTVDTHIKTLRAKLKQIDPAEFIVTHRGVGYSLAREPR